jgi:hypothetical protein
MPICEWFHVSYDLRLLARQQERKSSQLCSVLSFCRNRNPHWHGLILYYSREKLYLYSYALHSKIEDETSVYVTALWRPFCDQHIRSDQKQRISYMLSKKNENFLCCIIIFSESKRSCASFIHVPSPFESILADGTRQHNALCLFFCFPAKLETRIYLNVGLCCNQYQHTHFPWQNMLNAEGIHDTTHEAGFLKSAKSVTMQRHCITDLLLYTETWVEISLLLSNQVLLCNPDQLVRIRLRYTV